MLIEYIQAPYILTPYGLATPALIISVVYVLILSVIMIASKKLHIQFDWVAYSSLLPGEKKGRLMSIIGYIVLVFACMDLPAFLGEDSILLQISEAYLKYETPIFIILFIFFCTACLNKINRDTQINAACSAFRYLIWISVGTGILSGQIEYTYWKNIIVIVCGGVINGLFLSLECKHVQERADSAKKFDSISFDPVDTIDELFPTHRQQADDIASIISSSSSEPFSICLSGVWGSGKTSVIRGVVDKLRCDDEKIYDFVYINALELDDKHSVLMYLLTQIREKLKSRGVYVGVNSEYKEFASTFAGTLSTDAIGTFLQRKFAQDADYRDEKEKLEEVLARTYENGKLIVIVDDIERCETKIVRDYLVLIKEVATMRCCVSVFVTDYVMLNNIVSGNHHMNDFLSKFFNYRIDLNNETPEDMLHHFDKSITENDKCFWVMYRVICKSPATWYKEALAGLRASLEKMKEDTKQPYHNEADSENREKRVKEQQDCISLFIDLMQNPRNLTKFYKTFRKNTISCGARLHFLYHNDEVSKYVDTRNVGQVLYLLSFMEVFLPLEYERIRRQGAQYLDPSVYGIITNENVERRLLIKLAHGLIFEEFLQLVNPNRKKQSGYIKADIRKFIEFYLSGCPDLSQLVKPFTSQEEEWKNAILQSDDQVIKDHWEEMVMMVLQKEQNEKMGVTDDWRNETLRVLLEFAEKQVKCGTWKSDKLFTLFDSQLHPERYWPLGMGIMQTFGKHIEKSKVYSPPSEDSVNEFNVFMSRYAYNRCETIYILAHYLIPINKKVSNTNIRQCLLSSNKSLSQLMSDFLERMEAVIPSFSFTGKGWYSNYKELAQKIKDFLVSRDIAIYSDVEEDIVYMFDAAEELISLEHIVEWMDRGSEAEAQILFSEAQTDSMDDLIANFEKAFSEDITDKNAQCRIEAQFKNLFSWLEQSEEVTLSKVQLTRLHKLVERYVKISGEKSIWYRRILLKIPQKGE